jgi:hypothetical protein
MWMLHLADPRQDEHRPGSVRDEVGQTLLEMLPWGASLLIHVALVLLAVFVVWSQVVAPLEEEQIIPVVRLGEPGAAPLQNQLQPVDRPRTRRSIPRPEPPAPTRTMDPSTAMLDLEALAPEDPFGQEDPAAQTQTSFYGARGNARRIVFLIDASGSIIEALPWVIQELSRTIAQLSPQQSFTVIFFQQNRAVEVPPPGLKRATAQNKSRVIEWIDPASHNVTPEGRGNPLKAIELALRYNPQLLFILSDDITGRGRFEVDQRQLIRDVLAANRSNTKINTIQFLYPDPLTEVGLKGTLELIAERTGGVYRFVDEQDLYLQ